MSDDLRKKVIRLAHAKPELRAKLLPLLKEASSWSYWDPQQNFLMKTVKRGEWEKLAQRLTSKLGKPSLYRKGRLAPGPEPTVERALVLLQRDTDDGWLWGRSLRDPYIILGRPGYDALGGDADLLVRAGLLSPTELEEVKAGGSRRASQKKARWMSMHHEDASRNATAISNALRQIRNADRSREKYLSLAAEIQSITDALSTTPKEEAGPLLAKLDRALKSANKLVSPIDTGKSWMGWLSTYLHSARLVHDKFSE